MASRIHAVAASAAPVVPLSRRGLERELDAEVRAAVRAGRPIAQGLAAAGAVPHRVAAALDELTRRGCARVEGDDVVLDPARAREDGVVARLAAEARSAGAPAAGDTAPKTA